MNKEKICLNCGKSFIGDYRAKFCSRKCAAIFNNSHREHTTKGKIKLTKCIRCGEIFEASVHIPASRCICNKCKKHNRVHSKKNIRTIYDLSRRTISKILKRINAKCSICGWSESSCDIHHIIPKKDGGTDDMNNLIMVCPNCHRICHTINKYSIEYLKSKSIDKEYGGRKNFYYIGH